MLYKMFDQIEGRRVQPLQIIEKQREGMFRPGKHTEETPEYRLEARLLVLWRKVGSRRLITDDESKLRDEIDHELAVRAKRLEQRGAPLVHLRVALAEDLMDKALEGLGQRRVRDVTLVLVELAGREEAARRHELLVQLIDERGFSDAGISGHEHELRRALIDHPIERREQRPDLRLASVQLLRNHEPVR